MSVLTTVINAADGTYGPVPDGVSTDHTATAQAAIDAAQAVVGAFGLYSPRVTVFFPSCAAVIAGKLTNCPWLISKGLEVTDGHIEIAGDGATVIRGTAAYAGDLLRIGFQKTAAVLANGYRVDAYGVLDTTAAAATGQRYGLDFQGDHYLDMSGTPFSWGPGMTGNGAVPDRWTQTAKVTVDIAFYWPGNSPAHIYGSGDSANGLPRPLTIRVDATGMLYVYWINSSCDEVAGPVYQLQATLGTTPGLYRLVLQLDHTTGQHAIAWRAPGDAAITWRAPFTYIFPAATGGTLHENTFESCCVNKTGILPDYTHAGAGSLKLYGLLLSNSTVYTPGGAGAAVVRADANAVTDARTYFMDGPHVAAYFAGTDAPGPSRVVKVWNGTTGVANTWSSATLQPTGTSTECFDVAVRDITFIGDLAGRAVVINDVLEVWVTDCRYYQVTQGIAWNPCRAEYTARLTGNRGSATDAHVSAVFARVYCRDWNNENTGRVTYRFASCYAEVKSAFTAGIESYARAFVEQKGLGSFGGQLTCEDLTIDSEVGVGFSEAVVVAEANWFAGTNFVTLNRIVCGNNPGAYLADLKQLIASPLSTLAFTLDGVVQATTDWAGLVKADPAWTGAVCTDGTTVPAVVASGRFSGPLGISHGNRLPTGSNPG
jgi:hypothetical protein